MPVNARSDEAPSTAGREVVETRLFDAPRALVFDAWTKPEHVAQWWGPNGFTTTIHEMDVRPGGTWRLTMHGPDGRDYRNRIVFVEIARPERLVYKHVPELGTEPVSHETTVTFTERGGRTQVTVRMVFPTRATLEHVIRTYGVVQGLTQTLSRLALHLPTMR